MKILLTGHKGFIGSHLLRALIGVGHDVETYDWGDKLFPSVMEQDWVIHVGAISSTTEKDIEKVMLQNVDFTTQLYKACKTYGVNFQFASSASVYGLNKEFNENSPVDPRTPYAWSKYLCERYIRERIGGNITQIFRYFNVYGPENEEHKGSQSSPHCQFKKQAEQNSHVKVFKNSENYHRDFIHVSEIVNYHLKFLECKESGVFNLGRGKTKSFLDVAKTFGVPIVEIDMPENLKCSYQEYTCADMTKTRIVLDETEIYRNSYEGC
jgi:ADP-L-glycero-D-manno-heptose 6-epimerase